MPSGSKTLQNATTCIRGFVCYSKIRGEGLAHDGGPPCRFHEGLEIKIQDVRDRMARVERFIIALLCIFASSSIVTVYKLDSLKALPQQIVEYERQSRQ